MLPLRNLSGDPAQEFFADGMTEALITTLAQISALRVTSRTSAMQYKDVSLPLPDIARALNVDAVIEGSVLRAGQRVRITAQLIEAASDRHLWAQSYERDADDILALQGDVAQAIGSFDAAFDAFKRAERLTGGDPRSSVGLGRAYALAGRAKDAREVLAVLEQQEEVRFVSPFGTATIHAALGEDDLAIAHLERAFAMRDTALLWIRVHPRVDTLRGDPRFESLLRRVS